MGATRRDNEGMSAPKRPGAPRPSSSATRPASRDFARDDRAKPAVRKVTPGRSPATPSAGVPKPARRSAQPGAKTRPGGPSGPGRSVPQSKPRIEAAGVRGSLTGALSWRTAVLAIVVVLALAVLLPSLRVYFAQQDSLRELRAERDLASTEVEALTDDLARWDDPAFVVAQARERLAYVFPGETAYRVVDPELVQPIDAESTGAIKAPDTTVKVPWYATLWDSVEVAGNGSSAEPTP